MDLQRIINSRFGIAFGFMLSRLPLAVGYRVAQWTADSISLRKEYQGVQAVRANQWIVHDRKISAAELDHLVRDTFRNSARGLYEFWHFLPDKKTILEMVVFEKSFANLFNLENLKGKGLIIVLPHMVNFDLIGIAAALNGYNLHVLSYPAPPGGYRWQNKLRELQGLKITPISGEALRLASQTLSTGGVVVTGIDRPLLTNQGKYSLQFFSQKAFLPVLHIRLALKHHVPISVIGGYRNTYGKYNVWASEPVYMRPLEDRIREITINAETILDIATVNIRQVPDQWAMYYSVWPETLSEVPN